MSQNEMNDVLKVNVKPIESNDINNISESSADSSVYSNDKPKMQMGFFTSYGLFSS